LFNVSRHYKKSKEVIEVDIHTTPIYIQNKLYMGVIATDITKIIVFEKKITEAIIKSQEDERYTIGSELHDNVCQILAACQMNLGMLKDAVDPSAVKTYDQIKEYIVVASNEIRNLSHELAPAFYEDTTLGDTLNQLIKPLRESSKYVIDFYLDTKINSLNLSRELQLNLYRILQEQINNIIKHAQASKIIVDIVVTDNILSMTIEDNGVGFNMNTIKRGIGMANMKRRSEFLSGNMRIETSVNKGCRIIIQIPI
jgi:signal transduction histidine kinase